MNLLLRKNETKAAAALLEKYQLLSATIANETQKLNTLEQAEDTLADAAGHVAVDVQRKHIWNLRGKLLEVAAQMPEAYTAIVKSLPNAENDRARLAAAFEQEWTEAGNKWQTVLAKRRAIEGLVGKLVLPEPATAAPPDLEALAIPYRLLDQLTDIMSVGAAQHGQGSPELEAAARAIYQRYLEAMVARGFRERRVGSVNQYICTPTQTAKERA
jgi:hypothetical protein